LIQRLEQLSNCIWST